MTGAYAVVGDPIEHSLSPVLHGAGFAALGIAASYDRISIPEGEFDSIVAALREGALDGVNVTMPHKLAAFAAVDARSPDAERTGSVNTIVGDDGRLTGYNTDVAGVSFAVEHLDVDQPSSILILGAGGAAAAALVACSEAELHVSARTETKIDDLRSRVGVPVNHVPWGTGVAGALVINATPLGMHGEHLPEAVLDNAAGLVDMTYGRSVSPSVLAMDATDRPAVDGRVMLVGQALEAFTVFTGRSVSSSVMLHAVGL